jgi:hypothetical protein
MFLGLHSLQAQESNQAQITSPNPVLVYDTKFVLNDLILRPIDTSLENFHRYNPAWNWDVPYLQLSNMAQAPRQLLFQPRYSIGYTTGMDVFKNYFYSPDSVRYYNTKTPFTSARYDIGAKEEQLFNVIHSQNITPQINLAIDYRRLSSDGFFKNTKAGVHNFNVAQWYRSKNNRYNLMTAYVFNQVKNQENGGITVSDPFTNPNFQRNQQTIPVALENAFNRQDHSQVSMRQHFYFGPEFPVKNTKDTSEYFVVKPKYALVHQLTYSGSKFRYSDEENDSSFYTNFYFDGDSTRDNARSKSMVNELWIENFSETPDDSTFNPRKNVWSAGMSYGLHRWQQYTTDTYRHSLQLKGKLRSNPYQAAAWQYQAEGALELAPQYFGDFLLGGNIHYQPASKFVVKLNAKVNLQSPGIRWERWQSNHFQWDIDTKRMFQTEVGGDFQWLPWKTTVGARYYFVANYLYVEANRIPVQTTQPVQVLRGFLGKVFDWKRFYINTEVHGQWTQRNDIIRQPAVYIHQQMYYKGTYVKKRPIHAQFGVDITYFNSHKALGYEAALSSFVVQPSEKLKYYPILDIFFNLQVKRTRLFFMMQHFNAGLIWDGYYATDAYPMPGRIFRGGVSWQFYD